MRWVALLVAAAVVAGCSEGATGSPPPPGATSGAPIVLQGHGDSQTDSFAASGAYRVSLTASAWGTYPCIPNQGGEVVSADPAVSYTGGSFVVGTSNLPAMPHGRYYVRVHLDGCAWTVTLTPP